MCFCFTQASDEVARLEHLLTAERAAHAAATAAVADLQAQLRREQEESERWRHASIDHESTARRAADDVSRLQAQAEELKVRTAEAEAAVKKGAEEQAAAAAVSERWRHEAIDHESTARRLQALTEELKARTAEAEAAAKKGAEEQAAAAAAAKAAATRDQDALAEARAALVEETAKGAR